MKNNTLLIDSSVVPTELTFSPNFNVSAPFIDIHLDEGRENKVAIRTLESDITYRKLFENVNRAGNALKNLEIEKGDRVLMVIKDSPEFFYVFWGAIKAGYIPVPISTLLRAKDYTFIIEDSDCAVAIYSPEYAKKFETALIATKNSPEFNICTEGNKGSLVSLMSSSKGTLMAYPSKADDDCFWLYTSGSTGTPKGAVHAHKDMVITSQYYGVETLGITAEDVHYSAAKLFFAYGLGNAMSFPLWTGGQAVLYSGRPTPKTVYETIKTFNPSIFYGVPTLYGAQLHALNKDIKIFSSLRLCVSAGEPLPEIIFKKWKEKTGLTILDGIGTTETLHIFISNRLNVLKPGTSGKLVPGYQAKIVDKFNNTLGVNKIGDLMIKGESIISRYWKLPKRSSESLIDGWIRTGDSYFIDEDSFFVCYGRSDDMLKVGGIWVSPVEIEAQLISHEKVLEAAIVGRHDKDRLIKPEAYVVLKDPNSYSKFLTEELREYCKRNLAPYKYPRWFNFVKELPKTSTGKIQRFRLRE